MKTIEWPSLGANVKVMAEVHAGTNFQVLVRDPIHVKEWKKHLFQKHHLRGEAAAKDDEVLGGGGEAVAIPDQMVGISGEVVVLTIGIVVAFVSLAVIGAFAACVLYALHQDYQVKARMAVNPKTGENEIYFNFTR